jgi:molybdate transport system substrate-binding protein
VSALHHTPTIFNSPHTIYGTRAGLAWILHECTRLWRRARASGWLIVAKSMAVAMVERGSAKLACENKSQLVQARAATTSRALEIASNAGLFYAGYPMARRTHAISRLVIALCLPVPALAGDALVAVAANFSEVATQLGRQFEARRSHSVQFVIGSTGKLYAQIARRAPFDILLAADQERPRRLGETGFARADSQFTYAYGRLTLWSADAHRVGDDGAVLLRDGDFRALAIANPALAPYGAAAMQVLERLDLIEVIKNRLVRGQNAGQAHALVATGNAEIGLVALSLVLTQRTGPSGSRWDVPSTLHQPIAQDAILTNRGARNPAARAFMDFLVGAEGKALIRRYGYSVD